MAKPINDIDAQIAALEKRIADEPRRLQEQQERMKQMELDKIATIPPSDEVINRRRETMHKVDMTHGERNNARKEQAKDIVFLILCLCAIGALGWWLYSALKGE